MAASTEKITLGNDTWTRVAEDKGTVAIQIFRGNQFELFIGDSAPAPEDVGITISRTDESLPSHFSASGLPEGTYVALRGDDEAVDVVVLSY